MSSEDSENLRKAQDELGLPKIDDYEIISLVSRGSMSAVYKGLQVLTDRNVAIKVLTAAGPDSLMRFQLEAQLASKLKHPNIVTVYDIGVTIGGQAFISMDYLEGETLSSIITSVQRLKYKYAMDIFIQTCTALVYAHNQKVIHSDIKPSNIIVVQDTDGGELVKLVDFGFGKFAESEENRQIFSSRDVVGSPNYMSPEQCAGQKIDARSDIFSMGCVMYAALTGKPPLLGATAEETVYKHIYGTPRAFYTVDQSLLNVIPEQLEKIVFKALERPMDKRYQTMSALLTDLELLRTSTKVAAVRTGQHRVEQTGKHKVGPNKGDQTGKHKLDPFRAEQSGKFKTEQFKSEQSGKFKTEQFKSEQTGKFKTPQSTPPIKVDKWVVPTKPGDPPSEEAVAAGPIAAVLAWFTRLFGLRNS